MKALERSSQTIEDFLGRHSKRDWGDLSDADKALNDDSVESGGSLLSAYNTYDSGRIWIVTEADRSVTTVLLPEEY